MRATRGTGALVRLALRLDRIKLTLWILGLTVVIVVTASSFQSLYPTVASRQEFGLVVGTNPSFRAMLGPLFNASSIGGLVAWRAGIVLVLAGLMGLQTVVRHTRLEEETGRHELVGSGVVGRYAGLTAALIVAFGAGLLLATLIAGSLIGLGLEATGSIAFGLAVAAVVWTFAAVASLSAQLTSSARAANGIAGGALGLAYLLRALGDSAPEGDALSRLSWLSPIGWSQQLRPFADERWWVLGLVAALMALTAGIAYALASRRDVDAGLLADRAGPAAADPSLRSPVALAWRLQRGALLWWAIGFAVVGLAEGSVADGVKQIVGDNPQMAEIIQRLGGSEALVDNFLATVMGIFGVIAAVYAVQATLRLRAEETALRAEQVLATRVTRTPWILSHVAIAVGGTALLLAVGGGATGLAHGLRTGDVTGQVPAVVGGALAQLPAALVLAGVALALFGALPRLVTVSWALIAVTLLITWLGPVLQVDQWVLNLAPFTHVPQLPAAELTWTPLLWLSAVAVVSMALGLAGFRRRDVG
jgi:ABC-2 type transport system permease protein